MELFPGQNRNASQLAWGNARALGASPPHTGTQLGRSVELYFEEGWDQGLKHHQPPQCLPPKSAPSAHQLHSFVPSTSFLHTREHTAANSPGLLHLRPRRNSVPFLYFNWMTTQYTDRLSPGAVREYDGQLSFKPQGWGPWPIGG